MKEGRESFGGKDMITSRKFGTTKDGREVLAFTLQDGAFCATVLNLGGIVQSIVVPDRNGNPTDVVCGYNDVAGYENNGGYLGALIGRFGNRIDEGRFTLEGKEYSLYCNDRGNHLHGGKEGFDKKFWAHRIEGDELVLSLLSPDGEEGYPGNLNVEVRYSFSGGKFKIHYRAVSDKTTLCNLTNHAYFNMNGEGDGTVLDNELWIDCDEITPTNPTMIPVGGFRAVKGTAFDFNEFKEIGRDIRNDDPDLKQGGGYDHCHVLKGKCGEMKKYAVARSKKTGISMTCYTDMPAVQLYTGNGMNMQGKTAFYKNNAAFCLETQAIPNNVNVREYAEKGSSVLKAGEVYDFTAIYEFTA